MCLQHISCVFERAGGRAVSPFLDEGPSSRSRTEKPANRSPQEHLAKGGWHSVGCFPPGGSEAGPEHPLCHSTSSICCGESPGLTDFLDPCLLLLNHRIITTALLTTQFCMWKPHTRCEGLSALRERPPPSPGPFFHGFKSVTPRN